MAEQNNPKPLTFVLSDGSVNSHGFRVLTEGIDLSFFKKNPIILWAHIRGGEYPSAEMLPVGKIENVRKEDGKLLGDPVFDETDEFALKIKSKVEQGMLNMFSIYADIIATSEDPAVLVKGQTRPTVIKCQLIEVSLCAVGSNRNAVRLCDNRGRQINLSDGESHELLPLINQNSNNEQMNLQEFATALELTDSSPSEAVVLTAVRSVVQENIQLKATVQGYETAEQALKETQREAYLKEAVTSRKITQSQVDHYVKLYDANPEATRSIVDALPITADLSALGKESDGEVKLSALEARQNEVKERLKKQ